MNPRSQVAMPRKKGTKTVPVEIRRAMYAISVVGVRNCDIALHYLVHRSTVSHIIRQQSVMKKKCIKKRGCNANYLREDYVCFRSIFLSTVLSLCILY